MTENTTSMTLNECEVEFQRKRESVDAYTLMFHKQCEFFLEHYLSHILEMEPVERVKYIIKNFVLHTRNVSSDLDDEPDTYTIFCIDSEIDTLVEYCKKCFPGYKITYDDDEITAVCISKILSDEQLRQRKIQEDLKRLQQNISFKLDELARLKLEENKLETELNPLNQ